MNNHPITVEVWREHGDVHTVWAFQLSLYGEVLTTRRALLWGCEDDEHEDGCLECRAWEVYGFASDLAREFGDAFATPADGFKIVLAPSLEWLTVPLADVVELEGVAA